MTPTEAERIVAILKRLQTKTQLVAPGDDYLWLIAEAAAAIAEVVRLSNLNTLAQLREDYLQHTTGTGFAEYRTLSMMLDDRITALRKPDGGEGSNVKEEG
jgi:hypothetical protein